MSLTPGTHLGPYLVSVQIGEGGMGQVYRARDTRLDRDIALKILPAAFAHDVERLGRFQREAKTLASLNHPHIAAIYGLEESGGVSALVMELVEGEDLSQRIARGAVPTDEALRIAAQIAEALEAAHEQGIIHRDLKPANIKVGSDGMVKVLDFGLAKALAPDAGSAAAETHAKSPTITTPAMMTGAGVILGTAAYMAPEQAKGRAADRRSDVWAFGCVLFEMLAAQRAFGGEDVAETLADVLRREPDWSALPTTVPGSVRVLLRRCLTKDRKQRLDSAAAARLEINDALTSPAADASAPRPPGPGIVSRRKTLLVAAALALTVGFSAGYAAWTLKPASPGIVSRLAITLAQGDEFSNGFSRIALSPDGRNLVYAANQRLYLRPLDQLEATAITGPETSGLRSPRSPFFSPDGQSIGFWQDGRLMKVSARGGAAQTLCTIPFPSGVTWAADRTILFAGLGGLRDGAAGIWRVSENGGTPEQLIKMESGQRAANPQMLPDGRTVLFTFAEAGRTEAQVVVQSLDGGARHTVVAEGADARFLATGHLVYVLRNTLLGMRFDPASLAVSGPVPLIENVQQTISGFGGGFTSAGQFAVSADGTLVYVPSIGVTSAARRTLVWVDRQGREEALLAPPRMYIYPRLSPDGRRLALDVQDQAQTDAQRRDVWIWELDDGPLTKFTQGGGRLPLWTPDGQRLIFSSSRGGVANLFWQAANGAGAPERLTDGDVALYAHATADGRRIVVRQILGSGANPDLMILDLGNSAGITASRGAAKPTALVQTPDDEENAEISPDTKWLAYQSTTSGAVEIYVRPFPNVTEGVAQVSTAGGMEPLWGRDSKELYYRDQNGAVMRVAIGPGGRANGAPTQVLAGTSYVVGLAGLLPYRTYDVGRDGRFLMIKHAGKPAEPSTAPHIVVVQHWFEELKRLVPAQ